jgi:hypothetical protein
MTDTDQDQPPRSFAEDLGEDVRDPEFTDQPPATTKTAVALAKNFAKGRAEARHGRNLAQLKVANGRERDAKAHDEAQRRISRGEDVPPAVAQAAMRHLRQQGGLGLSSADLLAMGHTSAQPYTDDDRRADDRARREGRRPRS